MGGLGIGPARGGGGAVCSSGLRTRPLKRWSWLLGAALALAAATPAAAQAGVATTSEAIRTAKEAVLARTALDPDVQQQAVDRYEDALRWRAERRARIEQAAEHERSRDAAAADLEAVRIELAQPLDTVIAIPPGATLELLRQLRDQADAELSAARERLAELQGERDRRAVRRAEIPNELAQARGEIEALRQALAASAPEGEADVVSHALRTERTARLERLEATVDALQKELADYDARIEVMPLHIERATRRILAREAQLRQWREATHERAQEEAGQQARAARQAAEEAHPVVRDVAAQVVALIERRTGEAGVLAEIPRALGFAEAAEARLLDVMAQYERDRQRIEAAARMGMTDVRLRHQREVLVEVKRETDEYQRRAQAQLAEAQRERIDLEYERRVLPPLTEQRDRLLQQLEPGIGDEARAAITMALDRQLTSLRIQYDELIDALQTLERHLLDIERSLTPLIRLTNVYQRLIDERILWIRSMEPVKTADLKRAWIELRGMFDLRAWRELAQEQSTNVRQRPLAPILGLIVFSVWFVRRRYRTKRMRELAEQVCSSRTDQFRHTLEALQYTLTNALFWPALLWVTAWQLARGADPSAMTLQMSAGLSPVAWLMLLFAFMLQFARNEGLARAHFRWRDDTRNMLVRNLRWLGFVLLPLVYLTAASEWEMARSGTNPLSCFAFIASMAVIAIFTAIVMRPQRGVLEEAVEGSQSRWLERLRYFWYLAATLTPLALGALAGSGYLYTALQLENRLFGTFSLITALLLINALILRWLSIAERNLATAEATRKREESLTTAAREAERAIESARDGDATTAPSERSLEPPPSVAIGADGGVLPVEDPKLDIESFNEQARKILRTCIYSAFIVGLWLIWSSILPAISMLDRVEVWPRFGHLRETAVAAPALESLVGREWSARLPDAEVPRPFRDVQRPFGTDDVAQLAAADPIEGVVKLTNVLVCVLILIVASLIGRNIPGLLEMTVLQRLPLQDSARYAVVTLTRYFIIIMGTVLAFGAIGIGWSQVQWLVAAITLGLGFGLQEIVANFVSGIIILFERPIRVGDTVTVSDTSGTVRKIRMRATTIVDWDRKEMIIPNKTFITSNVINWTLNDPVLRIVIPVGIAYGSDTLRAEQTLLRVAEQHPFVSSDPAPSVVFSAFGDSSLDFKLRVFIPNISELIKVRHELHRAIDQAFREEGIEIAFPQRDIHVRTIQSPQSLTQPAPPKSPPPDEGDGA